MHPSATTPTAHNLSANRNTSPCVGAGVPARQAASRAGHCSSPTALSAPSSSGKRTGRTGAPQTLETCNCGKHNTHTFTHRHNYIICTRTLSLSHTHAFSLSLTHTHTHTHTLEARTLSRDKHDARRSVHCFTSSSPSSSLPDPSPPSLSSSSPPPPRTHCATVNNCTARRAGASTERSAHRASQTRARCPQRGPQRCAPPPRAGTAFRPARPRAICPTPAQVPALAKVVARQVLRLQQHSIQQHGEQPGAAHAGPRTQAQWCRKRYQGGTRTVEAWPQAEPGSGAPAGTCRPGAPSSPQLGRANGV